MQLLGLAIWPGPHEGSAQPPPGAETARVVRQKSFPSLDGAKFLGRFEGFFFSDIVGCNPPGLRRLGGAGLVFQTRPQNRQNNCKYRELCKDA